MTVPNAHTEHALAVVEFPRVLSLVAAHAVSECGVEKVMAARPSAAAGWIAAELNRVHRIRDFLRKGDFWIVRSIPNVRPLLRRLAVAGTTLDGPELRQLAGLLASSRICAAQLANELVPAELRSALEPHLAGLLNEGATERAIERAIGEDGSVSDNASPTLRRVRRELAAHREQIVTLLERIVASLEPHQRVADASVTVREGRYVIPVRREARNSVGGIVHDTSATGATLFMEPPAAIEHGNRMREMQYEERREVERILLELTDRVRPLRDQIGVALESLAELDSLFARALFAEKMGGAPFELAAPGQGFLIRDGRHPLLVAQGIAVVPFTLEMLPEEKTLLISGPNTGGKTVLLKTVALLSAMAQSGLAAPVGEGSSLAVFQEFFADIGDEQSIEASLSTFSAHLRNISGILQLATDKSLVLMDEIGSGTDPVEGAALAAAVLETLTRRRTITLATTHLGALQTLASELAGVVNASLQFDSGRLEPTYHFVKGIPGRSYGLSIARRLGLPPDIVANAELRVPKGERDLSALIATLEARQREIAAREEATRVSAEDVAERDSRLAAREVSLRQRERDFERESRKQARRHLLDSREQIERIIAELRAASAENIGAAARVARRNVENLAAEQDSRLQQLELESAPQARLPATGIAVGQVVSLAALGGRDGSVLEIRGEAAVVSVGAIKVTVPLASLTRPGRSEHPAEVVKIRGELPEERVSGEIDLRGMRVDEVDQALIPALDAAARADLRLFRIIHGKGTGALRLRVQQILAGDSRVSSYRDGAWNEGGIGVTVVALS
jgi:DNA mismatch repair protein MutS2